MTCTDSACTLIRLGDDARRRGATMPEVMRDRLIGALLLDRGLMVGRNVEVARGSPRPAWLE